MLHHIAFVATIEADTQGEAVEVAENIADGSGEDMSVMGPITMDGAVAVGGIENITSTDDLLRAILPILPGASVEQDNDGQVVIYTNKVADSNGALWQMATNGGEV
jgi:hypothetical protein